MNNRWFKIVIYLMLIAMLLSTLIVGIESFFE